VKRYLLGGPFRAGTNALMDVLDWEGRAITREVKEELELELILSHMTQKPMLRGEVGARASRVRSDVRGHGQARLCKALGCGK
jgi:hypothetical protein